MILNIQDETVYKYMLQIPVLIHFHYIIKKYKTFRVFKLKYGHSGLELCKVSILWFQPWLY